MKSYFMLDIHVVVKLSLFFRDEEIDVLIMMAFCCTMV